MRFERFPIVVALLAMVCLVASPMFGQSLTSGSITGTVFDPSHAVVPNATVNLKGIDTGSTATAVTNASGSYSFTLLKVGRYQVTVKQPGFAEVSQTLDVQVGQVSKVDVELVVAKGTETVEVSGTAPLINTEPSQNTAFTQEEVAQLPSAGGDITNIADTAPGVVVNGTGGYGNFTANGMPATSNLFTVNGENDMDPYFNINNSGASNLTLGQNEIGEATVITNPYGGQYGQLAGAQVTYVTKSGTNTFHGNAAYWWNGRLLNANNWMNKESQAFAHAADPTKPANQAPFSNANQWATSFGGPLIKNKTFFFVDYEGMRFLLPNVDEVIAPTPGFISAAEAQVAASNPGESATFNQFLSFYQNAPGYGGAVENQIVPNDSCSSLTFTVPTPGFTPGVSNCSQTFTSVPNALAWEYIFSVRVDQKLGNNDNIFGRYKLDHGLQPTHLDPLDSRFDANSLQPSWDSQVQETHVFSPTKTNSFTATLSHYVAQFVAPQAASVFNYEEVFNEDQGIYNFTSPNSAAASFPQGRNITQYQFIDDFSWTRGNHTFKFGENFRRYDISDHNFFITSPIVYWGYSTDFMQSFVNGMAYQYRKNLNQSTDVPVALWGIGAYGQDEWKATRNLKLTLALRVERNSNPVCQTDCFSNFTGAFPTIASYVAGDGVHTSCTTHPEDPSCSVPYTSDLKIGQHQAYPGVDSLLWSPRLGFSWDPRGSGKTVLSGGIGLFYDNPAAGLVDNLLGNPPASVSLRIRSADTVTGVVPFDPSGAPLTWQQSASAFNVNDSFNTIAANLPPGVHFNPPAIGSIVGTIKSPEWTEWNFSLQQELSHNTVLIVNYVGNHGARISYFNSFPNGYDAFGLYEGTVQGAPPAPNYGTVTEYKSGAISSYNGLTFSLRKQFSNWISAHLNYTWSHNIDETSNGGLFQYGFEGNNTILGQISPTSLRTDNYGNSDYDVRHLFNADFVINPTFHKTGAMKWLTEGWQFSGKTFWRTGLPYSIVDGNLGGTVINAAEVIPATIIGNAQTSSCGAGNASFNGELNPGCLSPAGVLDVNDPSWAGNPYSTQRRNQYRGPHYFDMDLNLFKNFKIAERFNFAIGAQAFNAFNHPNFGLPNSTYFSSFTGAAPIPDPTFGTISTMQATPTSPYGNFLGFDSSPRVMQLSAKLVF